MSAIPTPHAEISVAPADRANSWARLPILTCVAVLLGAVTVFPCLRALWQIWTTDALKSIGMFVPLVSLVLVLRAWRTIGWETNGSWSGLALILANTALCWIQLHSVLLFVISPRWTTVLPPISLPLLLYGSGAVLLLGGTRLFRAALFPIGLLWFANPVPHAFALLVDLPLQTLSAHIARSFAMHLGQPLTPDHLRLMFTPEFGMFIAPGCNGIRGSITMAFIALIAGYIYRFRWITSAAVVTGAVLLGYLFNLLRLCLLVLYYIVALHLPWLQNRAETADYIIGGALFCCASFLLFAVIHRLRDGRPEPATLADAYGWPATPRYAPVAALAVIGCVAGLVFAPFASPATTLLRPAAQRFPQALGSYQLVRTWQERLDTGVVVYDWAEYAPASGTPVAIAVSPLFSWHDPLVCHTVRGDHPQWQGPLQLRTAGLPVSFSAALYADGVTQVLQASTQCARGNCNEFATSRTHLGFIYSHVDAVRAVPILIRAEVPSSSAPSEATQRQLSSSVSSFVASIDFAELTRP
ncbi:MAG TPA: exosortase J [Acidobacteriaceae bacterium]|jgi:exosortase J|nr:exosortase J [Acidobacteriaceae bacterium]